ncbi:MAG TPA: WG repeat-containing protein, partial [Sphingobacteriaceae bacterium]
MNRFIPALMTCLMLFGTLALQAQNLKPFKAANGKYGYKDQNGKEVVSPRFSYAAAFSENLAVVSVSAGSDEWGFEEYKCGFIDKTGKEVISFKYEGVHSFSEGLAAVKLNKKWGFIDKAGKEVLPFQYDVADPFSEGLAVVKVVENTVGKSGFIDKTGKFVVPLMECDFMMSFKNGKAEVRQNGRTFYIDKTGKELK